MQFHLTRGAHQLAAGAAIRAGFARHNALDLGPNVVVCWGWRAGKQFRARGRDVLVLERGYLGDRFRYTSMAWNGLNGHATFPHYMPDDGVRFRSMGVTLEPWRGIAGKYVLLAGQVPGDMSVRGVNLVPWYTHTARLAAARFGLPVVFRPHPGALARGIKQSVPGCRTDNGTLAEALADAAAVVTWNSNTAVEAMLAGIWTVCHDPGAMAWPVAARALDDTCHPELRHTWAYALAFKQWTVEEIKSGEALEAVVEELRARTVAYG